MVDKELNEISAYLVAHGESVAVAESVTAGSIQMAFSRAKDAMKFFQGGITTYNIGQKARHLQIDPIHAMSCNCVSETVATQMALRASKLFSSQWGIGITGYASPDPEQGVDKLFAHVVISNEADVVLNKCIPCELTTIQAAQEYYADAVISLFYNHLIPHK